MFKGAASRAIGLGVLGTLALWHPYFGTLDVGTLDGRVLAQEPAVTSQKVPVGRSMVTSTLGIVATSQPLASQAGADILSRGGNAVDAAIAANAVLGLVEPHYNGIGGDLFAIYYEAKTKKLYGLNAGGWAPTGLTAALLKSKGLTRMPQSGIYTVTVPGAVKGWEMLRKRFGALPFSETLAPAIYYATEGFPVTEVISRYWASGERKLGADPNSAKTFLPNGHALKEGEIFRNPDLAGSLKLIAEKGAAGFYEGKTAAAILQVMREKGGTMTAADLIEYQPEWVDPISTTYRGWTVYELPPNTQGIAALMMLNLMEQYPMSEYGLGSTKAMHTMIEAKKLAYADMLRYVADPKVSNVPTAAMLSKDNAKARAALINPAKANCNVQPSTFGGLTDGNGGDTIYLSVIDKDGNIVSFIQSLYSAFGSGLVAPGTGIMLHNRGGLFTLEDGHPNQIAPRKRPLHTIIPAFMEKGDVKIGFGIMGGFNQAQAHAQFVSDIADYGLTLQQALEMGRFTKGSFGGCDVEVEALISDATRRELQALGHDVRTVAPRSGTFGFGQAVMSNGTGVHFAGSEPRTDGAAIPQAPPKRDFMPSW
ncbi:MAG: gamma-glutamyltransferase [Acidobacteria bacterium]|nr:MAG: gamma-glutamyltransferase [Acidobacteriota bacterium]